MSGKKIIALLGKAKSGKSTIGQMLVDAGGGVPLAFADKLKNICGQMYGLTDAQMNTEEGKATPTTLRCLMCPLCGSINAKEVKLEREWKVECSGCNAVGELAAFKSFWTPRMILQHVGTEGMRRIDPNVWVNYAMRSAESILAPKGKGSANGSSEALPLVPFVVITDCRFRSEIAGVAAAGGEIWRIRRPETDTTPVGLAMHASETEMDGIPDAEFSKVIINDGSLSELKSKVNVALSQYLGR